MNNASFLYSSYSCPAGCPVAAELPEFPDTKNKVWFEIIKLK